MYFVTICIWLDLIRRPRYTLWAAVPILLDGGGPSIPTSHARKEGRPVSVSLQIWKWVIRVTVQWGELIIVANLVIVSWSSTTPLHSPLVVLIDDSRWIKCCLSVSVLPVVLLIEYVPMAMLFEVGWYHSLYFHSQERSRKGALVIITAYNSFRFGYLYFNPKT